MCTVGFIDMTYIDSRAAAAITNSAIPRLLSSDSSLLAISVSRDFHESCQMDEASLLLQKASKPVNTPGARWAPALMSDDTEIDTWV